MKKFIFTILLALVMGGSSFAGWFDNKDQQRLQQTEQQLEQQREITGGWQIIAGALAIGAVVLFVVGTAIGSKARKEVRGDS
jgi:hypothetical protein